MIQSYIKINILKNQENILVIILQSLSRMPSNLLEPSQSKPKPNNDPPYAVKYAQKFDFIYNKKTLAANYVKVKHFLKISISKVLALAIKK